MGSEPRRFIGGKGPDVHASEPLGRSQKLANLEPVSDPVVAFLPWVQDTERELRRRLLGFQQRAGTRARLSESDQARTLWWMICDNAASHAFAPSSPSHLQEVLTSLARLSLSADAFERWEMPCG